MLSIRRWMNYCCREWCAFNSVASSRWVERAGGQRRLVVWPSVRAPRSCTVGLSFLPPLLLQPHFPPVLAPFAPGCASPGSCVGGQELGLWKPSLHRGFAEVRLSWLAKTRHSTTGRKRRVQMMCAAPGQPGAAPPELFGNLRARRGDARCPGCCARPGCSLEGICSETQSKEAAAGAVSCYLGSAPLPGPAG